MLKAFTDWVCKYSEEEQIALQEIDEAYEKLPKSLPISVLAIIPARGGSRRAPLKNITLYKGISLIERAIQQAKASRYITEILVSSDDDNIIGIASKLGVQTLKRPDYLATPDAKSESAIVHALYCRSPHPDLYTYPPLPDYLCLLQPTSPNRHPLDIDATIHRAHNSLTGRTFTVNQQLAKNGAVYVARTSRFLATLNLEGEIHKMPNSRSLDIDYPEDFSK